MSAQRSLSYQNMVRRPGRTAVLVIVSLFLSFSILAGTLIVSGLRSGLNSLETRLGADIMVVPYEATTKNDFSNILLQGTTGTFYMDKSVEDVLAQIDGVGQMSSQFYLATAKASCCSSRLQIISYDPETDFTVSPWIRNNRSGDPGYLEIVVGSELNVEPGEQMKFYGTIVTVKAKLDQTGTYLDTAVFTTDETIKTLIQAAKDTKMVDFGDKSPDSIISCVLINVVEGYDIEDVAVYISTHVQGVKAIQTQAYVTDITGSMKSISRMIGGLVVAVWVLAIVILMLAFVLITNERKKEFAVLRVIGASRRKLSHIIMKEALMINVIGSAIGAVAAVILVEVLQSAIHSSLGMPFLLPGIPAVAMLVVISFVLSAAAGSVAALVSARRISKIDPALILRGDN